jgi:hypothetical protein
MSDEKNESPGFRVVDRRSFSTDGMRREIRGEDKAIPETPPPTAQPGPEPQPAEDFGREPEGFEMLVSYLSTTAMFQLGLLAGPGGEPIPADLANARRTINLLEVLQEKTQGNLSIPESRLLDNALYELRMTYVEMDKRLGHKSK